MRIIAGKWRSRRLLRPKTLATRPMPDRVKQSIFDMLAVHYETPGGLPPLIVADLFAGSGSMGLEALSRGARECWFFERDRAALASLRENIEALAAGDAARVVTSDAWRASPSTQGGTAFELVFLDPPYCDADNLAPQGPVRRFLRRWSTDGSCGAQSNVASPLVGDGGSAPPTRAGAATFRPAGGPLIVFHHPAWVTLELSPQDPWTIVERRTFGTNGVTFLTA